MKYATFLTILVFNFSSLFSQKSVFELSSPDGKIGVQVKLISDGVAFRYFLPGK